MPSAIAPEETSTTSCPDLRNVAICWAQLPMARVSRPAPWLVTRLLPTLTTMRWHWVNAVFMLDIREINPYFR